MGELRHRVKSATVGSKGPGLEVSRALHGMQPPALPRFRQDGGSGTRQQDPGINICRMIEEWDNGIRNTENGIWDTEYLWNIEYGILYGMALSERRRACSCSRLSRTPSPLPASRVPTPPTHQSGVYHLPSLPILWSVHPCQPLVRSHSLSLAPGRSARPPRKGVPTGRDYTHLYLWKVALTSAERSWRRSQHGRHGREDMGDMPGNCTMHGPHLHLHRRETPLSLFPRKVIYPHASPAFVVGAVTLYLGRQLLGCLVIGPRPFSPVFGYTVGTYMEVFELSDPNPNPETPRRCETSPRGPKQLYGFPSFRVHASGLGGVSSRGEEQFSPVRVNSNLNNGLASPHGCSGVSETGITPTTAHEPSAVDAKEKKRKFSAVSFNEGGG
ncbi:hypothetical protein BZA05DRAFT_234997 [Tricharina praecox]|uniref:uncharacterized protein n=1 Tax=Tricharina praecox TaxID=43433 RepID=UPI00221F4C8F|nr:uncharacterized protein BZA05DRAFT_234997 [Tricharina praecox]KAI5855247.1 hypothetical protein BZA05DRAFT_234997 [Tricharina praecox]